MIRSVFIDLLADHMLAMLSPYLVKLVTRDVILVLLVFSGKVTTQFRCGGKILNTFVRESFLIGIVKE